MNLKIKPKLKIHKPPSEGRLNKDQIIKNFFDRKLEPKTHLELINDIVGKTQKISVADYRNVIKNGGEFNITIDNYTIRNDINAKTFDNSMDIASEILGIKREILEKAFINQGTRLIDVFEFQLDAEKRSTMPANLNWSEKFKLVNENIINIINYTILQDGLFYGSFEVHDAGHFSMLNDFNAQSSHINFKIKTGPGKLISGHIYYTN